MIFHSYVSLPEGIYFRMVSYVHPIQPHGPSRVMDRFIFVYPEWLPEMTGTGGLEHECQWIGLRENLNRKP